MNRIIKKEESENTIDKIKSMKAQKQLDRDICFDIIHEIFENLEDLIEILK